MMIKSKNFRTFFILLVFMFIASPVYSQLITGIGQGIITSQTTLFRGKHIDINCFSFGKTGIGMSYSNKNELQFEFSSDLFMIEFQYFIKEPYLANLFGLQFSAVDYRFSEVYDDHLMSFINPKIYFNLFDLFSSYGGGDILGPFFGIHWMNLKNFNSFSINKIQYEIGLEWDTRILGYELGSIETGVRYINNNPDFFIRIKLSNILPYVLLGGLSGW